MYVFELEPELYYKPNRGNDYFIHTDGIQWKPISSGGTLTQCEHQLNLNFQTTTSLLDAILKDYENVSASDFIKKLFPQCSQAYS